MSWKVGIDFGTSNSSVSISDGQQVKLLPIDQKSMYPEVVKTILFITRDHRFSIGQDAIESYYRLNINRIRRYVKKRVGEIEYHGSDGMFYVTDVYAYVDDLQPGRLLQYLKTALRSQDFEGTTIFDRYYTIDDILTIYLGELKRRSETYLGASINEVTLGRPVKFADSPGLDQKTEQILRGAAYAAGFQAVDFELEPVAAALYYELFLDHPENVLIFDFGGGTLDITIIRLGDRRHRQIFANGGIDIAGSDFDRAIIQKRMLRHFGKGKIDHRPDLLELVNAISDWMTLPELSVPKVRHKLEQAIQENQAPVQLKALQSLIFNDLAFSFYNAVEQAKIDLSDQGATVIGMLENDIDIWELYTRWQFEQDIKNYLTRIEEILKNVIAESGLDPEQIDAVVKTGGSSNIPLFSELLAKNFSPERIKTSNIFGSVAAGLGLKAAQGIIF